MKSPLAVLAILASTDANADTLSGGELYFVLRCKGRNRPGSLPGSTLSLAACAVATGIGPHP
jgi:hypothetical protein